MVEEPLGMRNRVEEKEGPEDGVVAVKEKKIGHKGSANGVRSAATRALSMAWPGAKALH